MSPEHEQKIGELVARIEKRLANDSERDRWGLAFEKLSHGDHYLSVLAGSGEPKAATRPWRILLIITCLLAFAAADLFLRNWMRNH